MTNQLIEMELQDIEVKESFKITDLESANWAFKKIAAIEAKQAEVNALADKEIDRIMEWSKSENDRYNGDKEYFQSILVDYYREQKEADSKFKLTTPYGKVTSRKGTKKWEMPNTQRIIEQLKERKFDDLVRVKEEINLADLKKAFKVTEDGQVIDSNGELLEGAYVTENPTSYTVKAGE